MKNKAIFVLVVFLTALILISGCTSQSGERSDLQKNEQTKKTNTQENPVSSNINASSSVKSSDSPVNNAKTTSSDSYYNIRIVPATVLENLQKEMGPNEYLVHNERGDTIGIVSADSLIIRGDLVQLERVSGNSGKDFDKTDVSMHLIDITFGLDNSKINLFKSNKDYKFWFDAYYTDDDVKFILNLTKILNSVSSTTQFEDEEVALGFLQTNYEDIPYNFYNIKIVTEKMLKEFFDDRKDTDHLMKTKDGKLIGMVNQDYLYLLSGLSEEDQQYYILKGLLYSMGLHGVSYKNKESFFYRDEGVNRELSDLDMEAIRLLYGGGLKSGVTLEEAKKTLGLQT